MSEPSQATIAARIAALVATAPALFPARGYSHAVIREARAEVAWEIYKLYPDPQAIADATGASVWMVWGWIKKAPKIRRRPSVSRRSAVDVSDGVDAVEGEPMTLEEVAVRMGITRERIRQIEERIYAKMRQRSLSGNRLLGELRAALEERS